MKSFCPPRKNSIIKVAVYNILKGIVGKMKGGLGGSQIEFGYDF